MIVPLASSGRPSALVRLGLVVLLVVAGCGGAATPAPSYPAGAVVLTAKNLQFDTQEIRVKAGTDATIVFVNRDSDVHNLAIRTERGFDGDLVFRNDPVGSSTIVLDIGVLQPGTYYFLCEVHPSMTGTVFAY